MDMRLELVPLPTTDVDRSKKFYVDRLGFNLDHDVEPGNGMRVVQLTPPGSACSIIVGVGISDPDAPRVLGLHLVVDDVEEVRAMLVSRDVDVSGVDDMGGVKYAYFSDPDGNSWVLQEIPSMTGTDLAALRRLAADGNEDAADRLAALAVERGDVDELKHLVDAGSEVAADRLAELAAARDDVDTLNYLIDAGNGSAADRLAERAAAHGDVDTLSRLADEGSEVAGALLRHVISETGQ